MSELTNLISYGDLENFDVSYKLWIPSQRGTNNCVY